MMFHIFYYEQEKDGGYIQGKVEVKDAVIYEQDSLKNPKAQFYTKRFVNNNWKNWAFLLANTHKKVVFFVPEGSIKGNINFDLN